MSKAKAIKLAKELHAPYQADNKDKQYWKDLAQELRQEKRMNLLVDEFQRKKHPLLKRLKPEFQNLPDFEVDIPVEKTDPPTVSIDVIREKVNVDPQLYSISFQVTVVNQLLDEHGDLEREVEEVLPTEPIKHKHFLKKYEKRFAGALTGFFNNYMLKLVKSLTWVKKIKLFFAKRVNRPRPLPKLKEALTTNCLIDVVTKAVSTRKEFEKYLKPRLDKLNDKYFESGCSEEAVDEIAKAVQVNIKIVSILQKEWYQCHISDHKRTLLICAHNKHATFMDEEKNMLSFLEPGKKKKVTYKDAVHQAFIDDPAPIKFPIVINDQIVGNYDFEGNLTKNRDIFFDEADEKKAIQRPELDNVFTLTSRYYTEFKLKYRLQDRYNNVDLYNFVKCADLYSPPWQTDPKYAENGIAYDQDRAYMFYSKSPFYDQYQFPRMPTHFYEIMDQSHKEQILAMTGFAEVTNVKIPMTPKLKFLRETKFIQDRGVYTTMRLKWLSTLGVDFDITKAAWSNDKQKLDFTIQLTDYQSDIGLSRKQLECSLMGRLIPNQSTEFVSVVHCKDDDEFLHLRYQLGSRVLKVEFDQKLIYYITDREPILKGAYHVHAYILDYQQIEFATKAMSVPFSTILKVKVDCLVLKKPSMYDLAEKLSHYMSADQRFTPDEVLELIEHVKMQDIEEIKRFEGWHDLTLTESDRIAFEGYPRWAGFHEENQIRDAKTPHLKETDFTHRHFVGTSKLQPCVIPAFSKFNEVTGSAGTGKTYTVTHWNLWDACILVPTNALRIKFAKECPDIPCTTFHKQFQTQKKKGEYCEPRRIYSTYIMDECSMICKGMMNLILTHQNAADSNIVLIHDRAQLAPVMPNNETWTNPQDRYFTNGEEYKKRTWNKVHLTEQKRQNDPRFIAILDQMRTLQDAKGHGLKEMIELLKERIISEQECEHLYRMDKEDLLIASTNKEVDRWNEKLGKLAKPNELKLIFNKNTTVKGEKFVNNQRVILQSEQKAHHDIGYASTVHVVQGLTFPDRMFVSLSLLQKNNNFDNHLLYTAVSRVKSLDQLYLVKQD